MNRRDGAPALVFGRPRTLRIWFPRTITKSPRPQDHSCRAVLICTPLAIGCLLFIHHIGARSVIHFYVRIYKTGLVEIRVCVRIKAHALNEHLHMHTIGSPAKLMDNNKSVHSEQMLAHRFLQETPGIKHENSR